MWKKLPGEDAKNSNVNQSFFALCCSPAVQKEFSQSSSKYCWHFQGLRTFYLVFRRQPSLNRLCTTRSFEVFLSLQRMVSLLVSVLYPLVILYLKVLQDVQPIFSCNSFHFCLCNSPHFCLLSFHFYLWIWASGNLGAHQETRGNLTVGFPLIVFRFQLLTIFVKSFISDVWLGSVCTSVFAEYFYFF